MSDNPIHDDLWIQRFRAELDQIKNYHDMSKQIKSVHRVEYKAAVKLFAYTCLVAVSFWFVVGVIVMVVK